MILGYDATTLVGHISGVGYYTRRLLQSLAEGAPGFGIDRILILSNRPVTVPHEQAIDVPPNGHFPIRSAWMQFLLPGVLRRVKPDVVHFTNYLAPLAAGAPYVVSFHDMSLSLFPQYHTLKKRVLTASLLASVARRARLVLTPSSSSQEDVIRLLGLDRHRVRRIPYAAPDRFRPAEEGPERLQTYGIRPPYFLYVGTIEPRKNLPRMLRAFSRLTSKLPDHRFVLVGQKGWKYDELLREAARPELRDRLILPGYVPEADLPLLYTHAEAFVYPSLYEGFGFPVVEAMACGTPVLTSASSSLTEIADGAALLVDPHDESALASCLEALATDSALRADLRTKGLARVKEYSWERTARETAACYREVAGGG